MINHHYKKWGNYLTINLWVVYIYHSKTDRIGWMRLFSKYWGIYWKHKDCGLRFSERYGYTKMVRIGNYNFKILKP